MSADDIGKAILSGLLLAFLYLVFSTIGAIWRRVTDPNTHRAVGRSLAETTKDASEIAGAISKKAAHAAGTTITRLGEAAKATHAAYQEGRAQPPRNSFDAAEAPMDPYDRLAKLKGLLDSGAITQDEFEAEKRKLLSKGPA